jgi:hypothetical protein
MQCRGGKRYESLMWSIPSLGLIRRLKPHHSSRTTISIPFRCFVEEGIFVKFLDDGALEAVLGVIFLISFFYLAFTKFVVFMISKIVSFNGALFTF